MLRGLWSLQCDGQSIRGHHLYFNVWVIFDHTANESLTIWSTTRVRRHRQDCLLA